VSNHKYPEIYIKMANPIVSGYSINDFYWTHTGANDACAMSSDGKQPAGCEKNQVLATQLTYTQTDLSKVKEKYDNTVMMYNRELILTVNMIIGVAMLIYYIYVNRDVLPAVPALPEMPKMASVAAAVPK
jgi:hypothetical protein